MNAPPEDDELCQLAQRTQTAFRQLEPALNRAE